MVEVGFACFLEYPWIYNRGTAQTFILYKQPYFRVEPRVAINLPSIFGIEAQGCLVVWQFWAQMYGKQAKIGKIDGSC